MADKAITLYKTIIDPNEIIVILLFNACAQLGTTKELNIIKSVASNIPRIFFSNRYIVTSLIDGYIKCGDIKNAESIFRAIKNKHLETYAAMMTG